MTNNNNNKIYKRSNPRSCVACKITSDKNDLLRFVKSPDGYVIPDLNFKLQGRGAYICPDLECLDKALKSGALSQALNAEINNDIITELKEYIKNKSVNVKLKLRSILGLARRSRTLLIGIDNIKNPAGKLKKLLVMTPSDSSENIKAYAENYEHLNLNLNIQELSDCLGSSGVQIIALPVNSGYAVDIKNLLNTKI